MKSKLDKVNFKDVVSGNKIFGGKITLGKI